jgi:hypothetical protein
MILTSNRGFAEWGEVFGDPVVATALLDRLLHHAVVVQIEGPAIASDSTPTSSRSTSAPRPSSSRRRSRPSGAADVLQRTEPPITPTADHQPQNGEFCAPNWESSPTKSRRLSRYPAASGCQVRCGIRQSMPSSSIASCAGVSDTLPSFAEGQTKRPRSKRFTNRQAPVRPTRSPSPDRPPGPGTQRDAR